MTGHTDFIFLLTLRTQAEEIRLEEEEKHKAELTKCKTRAPFHLSCLVDLALGCYVEPFENSV
jgi:hypothetical protein